MSSSSLVFSLQINFLHPSSPKCRPDKTFSPFLKLLSEIMMAPPKVRNVSGYGKPGQSDVLVSGTLGGPPSRGFITRSNPNPCLFNFNSLRGILLTKAKLRSFTKQLLFPGNELHSLIRGMVESVLPLLTMRRWDLARISVFASIYMQSSDPNLSCQIWPLRKKKS